MIDERRDEHIPLHVRPIHLMPGVADVVPRLTLPAAVWANTRAAYAIDTLYDLPGLLETLPR